LPLPFLSFHKELKNYSCHDKIWSLAKIPAFGLYIALRLTILNCFVMTDYDYLTLRYIRHFLPYGKIAFASFIGYAFSTNTGAPYLREALSDTGFALPGTYWQLRLQK
jgi:uncharacterized membrane protein YbhN (UPF0104 family)